MATGLRIAILGAGGTIGKVLMDGLSHHEPIGVTRQHCDLRDYRQLDSLLKNLHPDVVIHCASVGGKQGLGKWVQSEYDDNTTMISNLGNLQGRYGMLINIGSGAEFDIRRSIDDATESMLHQSIPADSYGLSKNFNSRYCQELIRNSVTLRVFGCFDPREPEFRLMRRFVDTIKKGERFVLNEDKKFSWISGKDLSRVVDSFINMRWAINDMNVAYRHGILLSTMLQFWASSNGYSDCFDINGISDRNYTCNTRLFSTIESQIDLDGFSRSLSEYR